MTFDDFNFLIQAGIPEGVVSIFAEYPYAVIFVSLMIGGGIILFPSFYLAIVNELTLAYIWGIMIIATIISDSFWYATGRGVGPKFFRSIMEKKRSVYLERASEFIEGRELVMLFYSKFVYGTRIAAQVICGARKVPYIRFLGVNIVAVMILGLIYYVLVYFAWERISRAEALRFKAALSIILVIAVVGVLHYLIYRARTRYRLNMK